MKRFLPVIPFVLLLFMNACGDNPLVISTAQWEAMIRTQTATMWTPAPTPTFNPNISVMVNWLNADLVSSINALRSSMDATYSVSSITFQNHSPMTFRIDVKCICMNDADCCLPERTFVVILEALKRNSPTAVAQVPPDVTQMMVVCFNQHNAQVGAITVSWQAAKEYLQGYKSGYELGAQVTHTLVPEK